MVGIIRNYDHESGNVWNAYNVPHGYILHINYKGILQDKTFFAGPHFRINVL